MTEWLARDDERGDLNVVWVFEKEPCGLPNAAGHACPGWDVEGKREVHKLSLPRCKKQYGRVPKPGEAILVTTVYEFGEPIHLPKDIPDGP